MIRFPFEMLMVNSQELDGEISSNQEDSQEPNSRLYNQVLLKPDSGQGSESEEDQYS